MVERLDKVRAGHQHPRLAVGDVPQLDILLLRVWVRSDLDRGGVALERRTGRLGEG